MWGSTSRTCAGLLTVALIGAGCAGPIKKLDGGYRHRRHGYQIDAPGGPGGAWKRIEVEHAVLAFRRPGPEIVTLLSRCGRPVAEPAQMARHLVIGLPNRNLVQAGPLVVAGRNAWTQTFDTVRDDVTVRVKTVTVVVGDCTLDWILSATEPFQAAEASFDAWWQSIRLDRRHDREREG
jgi:hypothetical protein